MGGSGSAMAARIHFHDRLWEEALVPEDAGRQVETNAEITMADRIRFHDRLAIPVSGTGEMN